MVEGLPTLKVFGRARAQEGVIATVTDDYRTATMLTLRVAFLSGLVLELAAALHALVAVEVGLRLLNMTRFGTHSHRRHSSPFPLEVSQYGCIRTS